MSLISTGSISLDSTFKQSLISLVISKGSILLVYSRPYIKYHRDHYDFCLIPFFCLSQISLFRTNRPLLLSSSPPPPLFLTLLFQSFPHSACPCSCFRFFLYTYRSRALSLILPFPSLYAQYESTTQSSTFSLYLLYRLREHSLSSHALYVYPAGYDVSSTFRL
jgi:hypothetical protein